ncbi:DUF4304 domain-containing protein [Isoptericola sp. NPDC057191]|uniref:DUF4304 domain-containing protein n=1 Tax=Isoptericola sp. NPDC057191 TaxID=3346041 RepID=UPI00364000BE
MITAQERFRVAVRDRLAPQLRVMGLRGSGQSYTLPSDTCWAQLGLQRFSWSNRDAVEFTVNLSVVSRVAWASAVETHPWAGAKPKPNLGAMLQVRFWERLSIVAGVGDYRWHLSADGTDEVATIEHLLAMIADQGVPTLKREVAARG